MKNIFFLFHLIFFSILIKFEILSNDVEDYYYGNQISDDENAEENDCPCDMKKGFCDNLCCCDTDCDESEIEHWRSQTKCIDEKDAVGIFADRCIDKNLVYRFNKRRGLKRENQTEDIISKKEDTTILNYCFSIDNSGKMTKNIKNLEAYFTENGIEYNEEKIKIIGDLIYNKEFVKENDVNDLGEQSDINIQRYIRFDSNVTEKELFKKSEFFSLYSTSSCQNSKNVEIFKAENYSCINDYSKLNVKEIDLKNIKFESSNGNCTIEKRYFIKEGLLDVKNQQEEKCTEKTIVEIEFLLFIENTEIKDCSINIVCTEDAIQNNLAIFKNSVIFTNKANYIPYRYSGNGGYLNNFPLKIYSEKQKKVYNEFFIVGRDKNGNCRNDDDIYNYLYNFDKPIYFKQDFSYSCNNNNYKITDTTLYKKITEVGKIAKYGSSSYNNINNSDWISVNTNDIKENDNYVIMNIYIRKAKNLGFYTPKYIYNVSIKSDNNGGNSYKFEIKFIDLDDENNESKYNKEPDTPLFIPNIPDDILDPLFYSDVDK